MADAPNIEAKSGDPMRREAALSSGAQVLNAYYPVPGMAPLRAVGYAEAVTSNSETSTHSPPWPILRSDVRHSTIWFTAYPP